MCHSLQHRAHHPLDKILVGLNFLLHFSHMTGFVGGLDVYEHQIIIFQRTHAVFALADVVGIEKSGDTRHIDALQPRINSQPVNDIHGGDDAAFDTEAFCQGWQLWRPPLTPEPDRCRAAMAGGLTLLIDWMPCQDCLRSFHKPEQTIRAVTLRHVAGNFLIRDVMGRGGFHLFFAAAPHHQMAVTYARKKFDAVAAQFTPEVADNLSGFLSRNMTAGEVFHESIVAASTQRDDIAAKSNVGGAEGDAHACGFQRRTSRVVNRRVVPHDAHVADVAPRRKALRNHMGDAVYAMYGEPIHVRRARRFEGRLATENLERIIRHAVALENDVFHVCSVSFDFLDSATIISRSRSETKLDR